MTAPSLVPTSRSADLATFKIKVAGVEIPGTYHVLAITVIREVNRLPLARVVLMDGDAATAEFEVSDAAEFLPGAELEVSMGYHGDDVSVYVGVVVSHSLRVRTGRPTQLVVECRDQAVVMTVGRQSRVRPEATDSDVIEEIIAAHGLGAEVAATSVEHNELVQFRTSDWDFVLSRAEANGQVVTVRDGVVRTLVPEVADTAALTLAYGSSLLEFEAAMDARDQFAEVTTTAWDHAQLAPVEASGADPGLAEPGNVSTGALAGVVDRPVRGSHAGQLAPDELQAWADGVLLRSRLAKIRGRVRCQGFEAIDPGDTLELQGVGERFSGRVFVSAVRHQFVGQNWTSDIQFGLDPTMHHTRECVREPAAAGLLPNVSGLEVGIVKQLEGDPEGGERVLVTLPMVDPDGEGVWARLTTPYAGDAHSICFRPELGDEVIVGFLSADPRDPVILGSTHSAAQPAPYDAADDNFEKGIITAGELKVEFHDGDKVIRISTPAGNQVELSEIDERLLIEDQNGNSIEMGSSGIAITAAGNLTLEASGDVSIKGVNVEAAASAELKAEGSSAAALKSGGSTTIKGSMVQIN